MTGREIVLCAPVRTAIGTFGGSLRRVPAPELGATAIRATLERAGLEGSALGSVVFGQVIQAGTKMNPARQAAIGGGVPVEVPAMTVNRVCGSGAQAIVSAAQEVLLGHADAVVAGGMENMDQAPYLLPKARWGQRLGDSAVLDALLLDGLHDAFSGEHSGWHTEDLVARFGLSREEQDRFALRSQQRFSAAQAAGWFDDEIVPVQTAGDRGTPTSFLRDEHNRPGTTLEGLARLKPAFRDEGTITAGNAPGLNSGAAAMVVAERAFAEARGLSPVARLVGWGIGAVEPGWFGLGPVPAVHQALSRAGWRSDQVDRWEINEAFAAITLAVQRSLQIDLDRVNVEGGAIAHGHAIGATGAILTVRLIHALRRAGLRRGIVTLCIGGGQGIALALDVSPR